MKTSSGLPLILAISGASSFGLRRPCLECTTITTIYKVDPSPTGEMLAQAAKLVARHPETDTRTVDSSTIYSIETQTSLPPTPNSTGSASACGKRKPGQAQDCNNWYLVGAGDTFNELKEKIGVLPDDLVAWNEGLKEDGSNLWLGYEVCVGTVSKFSTPPASPSGGETEEPCDDHEYEAPPTDPAPTSVFSIPTTTPIETDIGIFPPGDTITSTTTPSSNSFSSPSTTTPIETDTDIFPPSDPITSTNPPSSITTRPIITIETLITQTVTSTGFSTGTGLALGTSFTPTPTTNSASTTPTSDPDPEAPEDCDCQCETTIEPTSTYISFIDQPSASTLATGTQSTPLPDSTFTPINSISRSQMPSSGVDTHTKVGPTPLVQGLSDKNCVKWEQSVDGETCETFEKRHGVKKEDLERWNGLDCESEEGLWEGYHLCVKVKNENGTGGYGRR